MNELIAILDAAAELDRLNEPAVLATVVRVEGSSYRRPGAHMLATAAGRRVGTVSGGCLERDVIRQAWERTENQPAVVLSFDARAEDDGLWGLGLGCNGRIFILVERLMPGAGHARIQFIRRALSAGDDCIVATVFDIQGDVGVKLGDQFLADASGNVLDSSGLREKLELGEEIQLSRARRGTEIRRVASGEGYVDLLVEYMQPALGLVIVGAGFDAGPLADFAGGLGWRVTITDARGSHATAEHFPGVDRLVVCRPGEIVERCGIDERTCVVVMTHRYADDLAALPGLLASPAAYVGLLGPEHRKERILMDLQAEGIAIPQGQLSKLFAPIGLDIGADTPAEIAASVVAEIVAFRARRGGGHLRDFDGPIHDRVPEVVLCPSELG